MSEKKLSRADIVNTVYEKIIAAAQSRNVICHCTQDDVACCVLETFNCIKNALAEGKTAELRGFGTFDIKVRAAKSNARNLITGEVVESKEHKIVVFRPGCELKNALEHLDDSPQ